MKQILSSFQDLKRFCEQEDFKGWDPYDGLNSKIFQGISFLKKSALCRLAVIQGFKRFPINLRKIALVPKQYNAKGIGLLLTGYCNLYNSLSKSESLSKYLGSKDDILKRIVYLSDLVISLKSEGTYHGACWGYGFGWQSKAFYLPPNTPTVVATSFVVEALINAAQITNNNHYLTTAISAAEFILKDLNRIQKSNGFMFSYSPLDNRAVYNATLLGTKTLSLIYNITKDESILDVVKQTIPPILAIQNDDGSFPHSDQVGNNWRDNFHTGFKLESLKTYYEIFKDSSVKKAVDKGYAHWISNFFDRTNGIAKYYEKDDEDSLIDLHCLAQSIPTLYKLGKLSEESELVGKMIEWANTQMFSSKGYYYFQKKGRHINKIKYMRWPNSWMFYGLSFYLRWVTENEKD